ncbi:uncharacterized protein LOC125584201 isoform X2 [Brassica napus]|uniref:uncharacterized protein LOC125584201 isoform X2 n=1 Tax=Brassica napus TaxID=3708 RepID=UPI00207AD415|nr:uncharacterized protein LOC125584201 isoform X2 [Brassica napus]
MQVTLVPEVQAHLVFLEGGGFTVVIPPGHGFTLNVNAADIGAGGAGAAGAGGAGAAVAAGEAIAAITAGIEQHSTENTLSTTQILHMLMIDNTYEVLDIHVHTPIDGLYLYITPIRRRQDFHALVPVLPHW